MFEGSPRKPEAQTSENLTIPRQPNKTANRTNRETTEIEQFAAMPQVREVIFTESLTCYKPSCCDAMWPPPDPQPQCLHLHRGHDPPPRSPPLLLPRRRPWGRPGGQKHASPSLNGGRWGTASTSCEIRSEGRWEFLGETGAQRLDLDQTRWHRRRQRFGVGVSDTSAGTRR